MKNKTKKMFLITVSIVLVLSSGFIIKNILYRNKKNNLINISNLSKEFMDEYFEDVSKVSEEDKGNILIVTSESDIKDTYGATNIIEAPNNQYFLQYNSKEEKDEALKKLSNEESNIEVSENITRELTEDTVLVSSYNSWGVEAMGIDTLLSKLENKELNDVTVAIVDSGLDVDLFNEKFPGRLAGVYNVLENNENMYDIDGHGTHIAGTIAEATPNCVKILPIKIFDRKTVYETDFITAVNYITYNKNADIINMSYGGYLYSEGEYIAIEAAKEENIISVAAAGNENFSFSLYPMYPAAYENTITISAVDSNKEKADFSNYGNAIMFATPGVDIKSIANKKTKEIQSGTSMATPHAVGAVAILRSLNKDLTFNDIVTILRRYSEDLGETGWDEYYGYGFINLKNAQVCEGVDCDEYNVFKKSAQDNIEDFFESYEIEPNLTTYNYGSINNILNTKVKITYKNGKIIEYSLYEIKDIEMSEYDPYSINKQTINIKFKTSLGEEINDSFEVTNPSTYESVWIYNIINENEVELTYYKDPDFTGDSLYLPRKIDGYTVTGIADKYNSIFSVNWDSFKKVRYLYLPETLTKIGNNAFYKEYDGDFYFNGLSYVKSEAESISIGNNAFKLSTSLEKLEANLSYIGDNAFEGVSYILKINFSDNITHIGNNAFAASLFDVKTLTIPSSITELGEGAFWGGGLKEITFMNNIETIPKGLMYNNDRLEKVTLPESVKAIDNEAFYICKKLTTINLPDGLTTIGDSAFEGAFKPDTDINLTIPKSVTTIGENVFKDIPSSVTLYVYSNSVPKTYANDNNINYVQIDPDTVSVNNLNTQYHSFDKINMDNVSLELTYNEKSTRTETITDNIVVEYPDSRDQLRYGDTSIKLNAYNEAGYKIEKVVEINVLKVQPTYDVPSNLVGYVGKKLSEIKLPSNFEWMNGTEILSETGNKVYKARYVPSDTVNYSTVENIDISVTVEEQNTSPEITNYQIEGNVIKGIPLKMNLSNLNLGLDDSYTVDFVNNDDGSDEFIGTGDEIKIYHNGSLVSSYVVVVKGDVTGDGIMKLKDLLTIKNYILKFGDVKNSFDSTSYLFSAGDYSNDGKISLKDFGQMKEDYLKR